MRYDYVVVDTSKSLAPPALAALRAADEIFLITNLDLCSLRNLQRTLPILRDIAGAEGSRLRLVVNRYVKDSLLTLEDLESTVGLPVHSILCNDYRSVIESLTTGKLLVLNDNSQYTKELKELAARTAGRPPEQAPSRPPLLKRLFGDTRVVAIDSPEVLSHV